MKIKKITYLVPPMDLLDDRLDVFVYLEDDFGTGEVFYVVEITTPYCLSALIEESGTGFLPPSYPSIIVSKLTDQIIHDAIQSFIDTEDDCYWLKLYSTVGSLEIEDLNEILDRKEQEDIEFEAQLDAESDLSQ